MHSFKAWQPWLDAAIDLMAFLVVGMIAYLVFDNIAIAFLAALLFGGGGGVARRSMRSGKDERS